MIPARFLFTLSLSSPSKSRGELGNGSSLLLVSNAADTEPVPATAAVGSAHVSGKEVEVTGASTIARSSRPVVPVVATADKRAAVVVARAQVVKRGARESAKHLSSSRSGIGIVCFNGRGTTKCNH